MTRGQNEVVDRLLFYSNGTTPLLLADLNYLSAEIVQYGKVIAEYVLKPIPNPVQAQIEQGDSTNEVRIHISEAVSLMFREGAVYVRIKMKKTNTVYYDNYKYDIDIHSPFSVTI